MSGYPNRNPKTKIQGFGSDKASAARPEPVVPSHSYIFVNYCRINGYYLSITVAEEDD